MNKLSSAQCFDTLPLSAIQGALHPNRKSDQSIFARCLLNQATDAAIKLKGNIFQLLYRRYVPRLGHTQTIGVIAHRLCRLIWKILHSGLRYEERGPALSQKSKQARARRMIRELRSLGYRVELPNSLSVTPS